MVSQNTLQTSTQTGENTVLDLAELLDHKREFYSQDTSQDNPNTLAGFSGEWAIRDHSLIPQALLDYLTERFNTQKLSRVSIDDINSALNELWEGPGSMAKLAAAQQELHRARQA
jgi:hypothetical protein